MSEYRRDIDGLRAVAIGGVLAYHYGAGVFTGGFCGVDVFFVISGYLITSVLKREMEGGGFSLLGFYDRRIRRIVPALCAVLAATLAAGWFLLMPGDYAALGGSTICAAFGLANIYFYRHTGYFDRAADLQPLLHTWSLGVEEQFYLAWPVLLWLGLKAVRSERLFRWLFAAALGLSFAYAVRIMGFSPKHAFYVTAPRAWELATGGLLVFLPAVGRGWSIPMEGIGLASIAWSYVGLRQGDSFPGFNALWPCVGAALLIWPKQATGPVGAVLSLPPLRWIGWLSYSLYLWHWPVLVLYRAYIDNEAPSPGAAAGLVLITAGLSFLSWRYVETPFRRARPIRWRAVGLGLAGCTALALLGAVVSLQQGFTSRVSAEAENLSSLDVMWQWDCPREEQPAGLTRSYCNFGVPWKTAGSRALLWGDSHAEHMAPIVEAAAKDLPTSFLLYTSCPAALGGHVRREWTERPGYVEECAEQWRQGIELLHRDPRIDLVVLAASWTGLANRISQDGALPDELSGPDLLAAGIDELIDRTSAPGRRFIVIADVPQLRRDPVPCVVGKEAGLPRKPCPAGGDLVPSALFHAFHGKLYAAFSHIGLRHPNTSVVLPGAALCAGKWCQAYLDGEFLYRDATHLRRNLAEKTRADFAELIGLTATLKADAEAHSSNGPRP